MGTNVRTISGWNDLQDYGINCLTGESCVYSLRMLCDLSLAGVEYITEFLGDTVTCKKGTNWNSEFNGNPAIASVLLPKSIFTDLAVFLLLRSGWDRVLVFPNEIYGLSAAAFDSYPGREHAKSAYFNQGKTRNTHAMSGRTT